MKIEVRRADSHDLEALSVLFDAYRQFYSQLPDLAGARNFLQQRIANDESVVFLAALDGKSVGFVQLYPLFTSVGMRPVWLLNDLYVAADARRSGVATALMEAARRLAQEEGAAGVMLETQTGNRDAQALYEKLGYRRNNETWFYFLATDK